MINKETFSKHFAFIFSSIVKGCSYINVNSKLLMSGKFLFCLYFEHLSLQKQVFDRPRKLGARVILQKFTATE